MKKHAIAIICLAATCAAPNMSAQSIFKDVKNVVKNKLEKKVKKAVTEKVASKVTGTSTQSGNKRLEKQVDAMVGKRSNKNMEDQAPTVRLPKTHTALFAPLGYPIEAKYGIKKAKPVAPPKDAKAQSAWNEKLPNVQELDNQSLVDEYLLLDDYVDRGIVTPVGTDPASWRYHTLVCGELGERCGALDKLVEKYNEAMDEYADDDTYNWIINGIHRDLAAILEGRAYKTLIRSSLKPLFTVKNYCVNDRTKAYFADYGGYENAHKATMTVWNPEPNRKSVSTSAAGQSGEVVNESGAGATIDMAGVTYTLHNKGNSTFAFISKVVTTAVAGKDLVIPDYVTYNGKKYPVTSMRGEIFKGTTIRSVKLPSTLREIPNSAFRDTPITEITIPASVNIIQGSAFYGCKKLAKVVFEGNSAKAIHGCFQNCISLTNVTFPRSVGQMSYDMFSGCINLTSVSLPNDITEIYKSMFKGCKKLKAITIPRSVTTVGESAFANSGIVDLDLSSAKELGLGCLSGCASLKSLKVNASLKANFMTDTYSDIGLEGSPALQLRLVNDKCVLPTGITFVTGK